MATSFLYLAVLTIVFYGQTIADPDPELLVPNYDNVEHKLKGFDLHRPLVLHCNITKDVESVLSWEKNGIKVSEVKELDNRYRIIEAQNIFSIARTVENDSGKYSCVLGDIKKEFNVLAAVVVRAPSNVVVPEFGELSIPCEAAGSKINIHWEIGGVEIHSSTERYQLEKNEDGIENAVLKMKNVALTDRGDFLCVGSNVLSNLTTSFPEAQSVTFVRVRSQMAPVWPGLGILAEVVILGVITIFARKADKKLNFE